MTDYTSILVPYVPPGLPLSVDGNRLSTPQGQWCPGTYFRVNANDLADTQRIRHSARRV